MIDQFRLTPDEQRELRNQDQAIRVLRETIAKGKAIGLPLDEYQERLDQAVKIRDGLIREFGNPVMPQP